MNIPVLVLLGFAGWTLLLLAASVGIYRWSHILTGRARIAAFPADAAGGSAWYQRATRAHLNCIENLPVYGAIVLALQTTGIQSQFIDWLSVIMLAARIVQSSVHVGFVQTDAAVSVRFSFYSIQLLGMIIMGVIVAVTMLS